MNINISISPAPRSLIRSSQCGDWMILEDGIRVLVFNELSGESQLAVAIHELVEAYLCQRDGVTEQEVCDHDDIFEAERLKGKHDEFSEPGDDPRAPYREQHQAATHVERAVCHALGLDWNKHCESITK